MSVHDMVMLSMNKNEVFGIEGYNLPRQEYPFYKGTLNVFPKTKGKNFAEVQASYTKVVPGPGEYDVMMKWGCTNKPQVPTKKNTYIDQITKSEKDKPSPS